MSVRFVAVAAALGAGAALLGLGGEARAQGVDDFGAYGGLERAGHSESPQNAAFELRFGRYAPDVDESVNGSPFADTFGNDKRFSLGVEVDWQMFRIPHVGTVGPGIGWSMTRFSGRAPFTDSPTGELSEESTVLWVMPMHLVGVLRFDFLARDFGIPFVPYGKLGIGYALWWNRDGDKSARYEGVSGKGGSYGLTWALGGMFLLDIIDQGDAASADSMLGINNSYLFAEWYRPRLDGFDSNDQLNLGSSSWVVGIALEM